MGFLGKVWDGVKSAASSAVSEVSNYVTKGVGKVIHDALTRMGIPGPLASIVAMAFDPMHAGKNLGELIDEVGKELGVPESVRSALKRVVEKADDLVKTAATQGLGGVIREIGKELGLPPTLTAAIALAADCATGNGAAIAQSAAALALQAADELGIPREVVDVARFGVAAYQGDVEGMKQSGTKLAGEVLDHIDMPDSLRAGLDVGLDVACGDTEAAKQHGAMLASRVADDILPDELAKGVRIGADLYRGDTAGAARELGVDEKYVKMGLSAGEHLATHGTEYLDKGKRMLNDSEYREKVLSDAAKTGAEAGARYGAGRLGIDSKYVDAGIDVVKNRDAYLAKGKEVLDDPDKRKALLDKAGKVALEQGAHFAGKKLGLDDRTVDAGVNIIENRQKYIDEGKKLLDDPEYRKSQMDKAGKVLVDKGLEYGANKVADELHINRQYVQTGVNVVRNADKYIDEAKELATDPEARKALLDKGKAKVEAEVHKTLDKAEQTARDAVNEQLEKLPIPTTFRA